MGEVKRQFGGPAYCSVGSGQHIAAAPRLGCRFIRTDNSIPVISLLEISGLSGSVVARQARPVGLVNLMFIPGLKKWTLGLFLGGLNGVSQA